MSKSNHVSTGHVRRNARRIEAITRAAQRDLRTTNEQLALIAKRPGKSARETARLKKAS